MFPFLGTAIGLSNHQKNRKADREDRDGPDDDHDGPGCVARKCVISSCSLRTCAVDSSAEMLISLSPTPESRRIAARSPGLIGGAGAPPRTPWVETSALLTPPAGSCPRRGRPAGAFAGPPH